MTEAIDEAGLIRHQIKEARTFLSQFKKEVNHSCTFGDAEVYYMDGDKRVVEGYIGSNVYKSEIEVNGTRFIAHDAKEVMK